MLRRALPVLALLPFLACNSSSSALQPLGARCDEDVQCQSPYVCACVGIRGTGDDGNDEITKHGTCQARGFKCNPSDGGLDAAQFLDTGARADVGGDAASDPASDAGSETAGDAAAEASTDAPDDTTDAAPEAGGD